LAISYSDNHSLAAKDRKQAKKVARETLDKLKAEKLKIKRWRESRQVTA
jgi:type I restriction enzyme R subunit